jgi:adenylate cyclase
VSRRTKNFLRNLAFNVAFCTIAGNLFVIFRFFGTLDFVDHTIPITSQHLYYSFIEGTVVSVINGIAISFIDLFVDTDKFKRRSFRYTIIFKSLAYTVSILVCIIVIFALDAVLTERTGNMEAMPQEVGNALTRQYVIAVFLFIMLINVSVNFIKEANKKFGPGIMWKLFSGRYYHPVVEERIFMFLDLKASTTIAEKLGHIKYSRLIQDCFYDVTDVIDKYKAEIYQYVGDEIVVTWDMERGIDNENCFRFYFEYMKKLAQSAEYYKKKYGVMPEFKAGANCGSVTVCEIGEIKKDIAYHGDVLNTASRIQGQCNIYNKQFLISNELKKIMPRNAVYKIDLIGEISLKGKENMQEIYSVEIN